MIQNSRWYLMVCILILLSIVPITEASASPNLELKASAGYQNKIKYGKGLPLTISVVNTGDEFSGDLLIDYSESYAIGSAKAIPITIGKGETKTLSIALPGLSDDVMSYNSTSQMFYFYEGGWKDGKSISYKGNKSVRPHSFGQETNFFLTLTESADRLSALSTSKLLGMASSQTIHLGQIKDFHFPTDKASYEIANYLVIDEYVLADKKVEQQQAIIDWVQSGGVVLVGASNNISAELGLLAEQLPLNLSDDRSTLKAEELTEFTNNKEFTEDIPIFVSSVNEASRLLWSINNTPIAAIKSLGKGAIIQTVFSLGDEPLSKQVNYSYLLTELINKATGSTLNQMNQQYHHQNMKEQMSYEVGQTNELFPSFQVSTPLMITIVIFYMVLVGPLLYFLLKRKDKRGHAWWIIPTISILVSVAIFAYGAKDRFVRPQIQQASFYKVHEDASISGYYINSLLSNRSGDFTFASEKGTSMVASKRMNSFSSNSGNVQSMSILKEQATKDQLTIRDVGYWSVSSVIGESHIDDIGEFGINLTVESGLVKGTVKNDFPFALKDIAIWSGTELIKLGNLNPNESLEVNESIKSAMLLPIAMSNGINYRGYGSPLKASDLPIERKNSLLRMIQMTEERQKQPVIVAYTEDAIVPISLVGSRAEMSAINVLYQPFTPNIIFSGEFYLPSSAFEVALTAEDLTTHIEEMNKNKFEWFMPNGTYSYEWTVPTSIPLKQVNWTELQLTNANASSTSLEIYNHFSGEYEELSRGRFGKLMVKDNVSQYVSENGKIQFKVNKQAIQGHDHTRLPELSMKGVVQND